MEETLYLFSKFMEEIISNEIQKPIFASYFISYFIFADCSIQNDSPVEYGGL